ncbi:hypothetical protein AKJ45_01105 [candidate division MSBL1 archaeon SCGC-AAA261F19]|uniref:Restriction endonuclease type IV Mrr domain-containing protein n=2 Tax=candidate division MSBL1 TaxID=215777 RepID=A0A133VB58_9EURY|nr:hypothetical protein AKJ43_01295 [candidate division MSBL1 archaeon SCGC-AAA261D19]KXB03634.1 hypothetical protein AKJ45_01105 [candidate division MSBL1 archaeon SCGC-AAA261F19]
MERKVVKKGKGRPSILVELTEKGRKGLGTSSLGGAKAGGELHRAMIHKVADWYRKSGYGVEVPRQAGRKRQPDLRVYPEHKRPFAVEVETSAKHSEQVRKNYRKNVENGMDAIFITPSEKVKEKVERILKDSGIDAVVYVF